MDERSHVIKMMLPSSPHLCWLPECQASSTSKHTTAWEHHLSCAPKQCLPTQLAWTSGAVRHCQCLRTQFKWCFQTAHPCPLPECQARNAGWCHLCSWEYSPEIWGSPASVWWLLTLILIKWTNRSLVEKKMGKIIKCKKIQTSSHPQCGKWICAESQTKIV